MQAHDDPELRARVRAELLYPANVTFIDQDEQARRMWHDGFSIGDIATLQNRAMGDVYRAVKEQFHAKFA